MKSAEKIGVEYSLSRESVARYLRINKLNDTLKERLDNGELAIRTAVSLSYLSADQQQIVDDILDSSHYKIDIKKQLRCFFTHIFQLGFNIIQSHVLQ